VYKCLKIGILEIEKNAKISLLIYKHLHRTLTVDAGGPFVELRHFDAGGVLEDF